jgi:hypothetical protein
MSRGRCIKNFADLVVAAIPPATRSKPVELWWQDASRKGQQGNLTRIWAGMTKGSVGHSPME